MRPWTVVPLLLFACSDAGAQGGAAEPAPGPAQPLRIEYRRVYATGERVEFVAEESGYVTGKLRLAPEPGGALGAESAFDALLPVASPMAKRLERAGFWSLPAGGAQLAEDQAGVRLAVRAKDRELAVSLTAADLEGRADLARALAMCEVHAGAGARLAEPWTRRGDEHFANSEWTKAIKAYQTAGERVPRVLEVAGHGPWFEPGDYVHKFHPEEEAGHRKANMVRLASIAGAALAQGESDRCFPDRALWPDENRSAWPADGACPSGFVEESLTRREDPTQGIRYLRPAGWLPLDPGGEWTAPAWATDLVALGRHALIGGTPEDVLETAAAETTQDASLLEWLTAELERRGARLVYATEFGRPRLRHAHAIGRAGDRVWRLVAVQSGKRLALARLSARVGLAAAEPANLARVLASLEPKPLGVGPSVEPFRHVAMSSDTRTGIYVPQEWKEFPIGGAPARADFRDFAPPEEPPTVRLAVRVTARPADFDWGRFWSGIAHPFHPVAKSGGLTAVTGNRIVSYVRPRNAPLTPVRFSHLAFGEEQLPVYWFSVFQVDRVVAAAVVCARDDPAALARGRALAELVAAQFE